MRLAPSRLAPPAGAGVGALHTKAGRPLATRERSHRLI